tara:strand:+ start:328 stop:621 length:294 start_codon:yes stop_codon:yes gene_type:complete
MDIGNNCVCCNQDTSFGSGKFVNRIPSDADYESLNDKGIIIFKEGEYRDGYLCVPCQEIECHKCSKMTIDFEFDITINNKSYEIICGECIYESERNL